MKYKRTPVTTREIIKYIQLRIRRFGEVGKVEASEREKLIVLKRKSELDRLLGIICNDNIKQEIEKMKRYNYTKFKRENKNETKEEKIQS